MEIRETVVVAEIKVDTESERRKGRKTYSETKTNPSVYI
jgi:ribosome-associated protein YbcJ (S4-like RNA binding protein)